MLTHVTLMAFLGKMTLILTEALRREGVLACHMVVVLRNHWWLVLWVAAAVHIKVGIILDLPARILYTIGIKVPVGEVPIVSLFFPFATCNWAPGATARVIFRTYSGYDTICLIRVTLLLLLLALLAFSLGLSVVWGWFLIFYIFDEALITLSIVGVRAL